MHYLSYKATIVPERSANTLRDPILGCILN